MKENEKGRKLVSIERRVVCFVLWRMKRLLVENEKQAIDKKKKNHVKRAILLITFIYYKTRIIMQQRP
jgi:hypothetical protein